MHNDTIPARGFVLIFFGLQAILILQARRADSYTDKLSMQNGGLRVCFKASLALAAPMRTHMIRYRVGSPAFTRVQGGRTPDELHLVDAASVPP